MAFIGILIAALVAFVIHKDAKERGMNALAWAICTFLLMIVALPVYLIVRKPRLV